MEIFDGWTNGPMDRRTDKVNVKYLLQSPANLLIYVS